MSSGAFFPAGIVFLVTLFPVLISSGSRSVHVGLEPGHAVAGIVLDRPEIELRRFAEARSGCRQPCPRRAPASLFDTALGSCPCSIPSSGCLGRGRHAKLPLGQRGSDVSRGSDQDAEAVRLSCQGIPCSVLLER